MVLVLKSLRVKSHWLSLIVNLVDVPNYLSQMNDILKQMTPSTDQLNPPFPQ